MKLWDKGYNTEKWVEEFTAGKDRTLDLLLAKYDIWGSMAHIAMLVDIGLLTKQEQNQLHQGLKTILGEVEEGRFVIDSDAEDVHSQVEFMLTKQLGDIGKKIHAGRSRNDQVLVDLKLFMRSEIDELVACIMALFDVLLGHSDRYKEIILPGYTHLQVAMPSSFGLWFGAYAESLIDDMYLLKGSYDIVNQNPLGSAAGYGSSFPLNRTMTTQLLGFDRLHYNVVAAQMSRGKTERALAFSMSSIAQTLSKMSMDICLYMSQNFGFLALPKELTTGSSIMPHKKNPDVFELIRGKCNKIQSLPSELGFILTNLPSGYHRDYQVIKESFLPAILELKNVIQIATHMMQNLIVKEDFIREDKYKYLYTVEDVNKIVMGGVPFRDAYKQIGEEVEKGRYTPTTSIKHTHEGSIGNLCTRQIKEKMHCLVDTFNFNIWKQAIKELIK